MPNVRRVQQLSVFLENKTGQMALLTESLAEAGIRVVALTVADTIEHGLVRVIVDEPETACRALETDGFNCLRAEVLEVQLPDRVGALAAFARCLGDAGVNILYTYGCRFPESHHNLLYVRVLDLDIAEEALSSYPST